jgi:hypothetical protein
MTIDDIIGKLILYKAILILTVFWKRPPEISYLALIITV